MTGDDLSQQRRRCLVQVIALALMVVPVAALQPALWDGRSVMTWLGMAAVGLGMALAAWMA